MLKEERINKIKEIINSKNFVKISDLVNIMNVTEMTIRRDLKELEKKGFLERVHGGAKKLKNINKFELSHIEKRNLNLKEKIEIAKKSASLLEENDTFFLGPGTTIELIFDYINISSGKMLTNSIHVFNKFVEDERFETILIGGRYRKKTGAFIGSFSNEILSNIRVNKCFISANGIYEDFIYTSNEEEGSTQNIILNNSDKKFIVADYLKIHKEDFYKFFRLSNSTKLITNSNLDKNLKEKYIKYIDILY